MKKLLSLLVFFVFVWCSCQQTPIFGTIKDIDQVPIHEVNIEIGGVTKTIQTNSQGYFSITTERNYPFLIRLSRRGFKNQEIKIENDTQFPLSITMVDDIHQINAVVISARRKEESAQNIPIPISIIRGATAENNGAFNVNRLKEIIPSVQLYSSNPRNTTLNIRGLGSTFGLTNDGIEPGVGFYMDGVYYARPAVTALDFVDIEQIEVLRGPQGTLFGKNTTAGAFNITSRAPNFSRKITAEVSYGNYNYLQGKLSINGGISKRLAGRISFSGTRRDGLLENRTTGERVNSLNNIGFRGQLLYTPWEGVKVNINADYAIQNPNGYAQVYAGTVLTKRAAYRQFDQIIADLGYSLPSKNPFDRIIDTNTPWKAKNEMGGVSLNIEAKLGKKGTINSITAWRFWNWTPSNDRDFLGLDVLSKSEAPSQHQQWTQEIRYSGKIHEKLSGLLGFFALYQNLESNQIEESGNAQWRFSQNSTNSLWKTPQLLNGYGIRTNTSLESFGNAVFGQLDWNFTEDWNLILGGRYNYDSKLVSYDRKTYGGLSTNNPALLALKKSVYSDQNFSLAEDGQNFSGNLTISFKPNKNLNLYSTLSNSYKPFGINLGGIPTENGRNMTELAKIKPEKVLHYEIGVKSKPNAKSTLNLSLFATHIKDYQTQVQSPEIGVNRGYLSNAEKVSVLGGELDFYTKLSKNFSLNGATVYTDGKYVQFSNAPVPLEEVGGSIAFKDISGGRLPGISKWTHSLGGEYTYPKSLLKMEGSYFIALDGFYRSGFSSSPSPSQFLNIDGYALLNGRIGFRAENGFSITLWGRNILNQNYFEQLLPAGGSSGYFVAVLGDQRSFGITMRHSF